jgi:quercetin dioxygenase-like cupin family protein
MDEFAMGGTTGRHTQPGDEWLLLRAQLEILSDGSAPRGISAGEAYHNPKDMVHEARNVGDGPARVAVTFIIDKGKPITQAVQ